MSKIFKFLIGLPNYLYHNHKVKNIDYFDYRRLVSSNHKIPYGFGSVLNYGNWKAVARLKGSAFNFLTEYLEHGVSFFQTIDSAEYLGYINRKGIKKIYTFGEFRKKVLENYLQVNNINDRKVITVGPYIKGADFFYDEAKRNEIKKKYGKILLVFPAHSFFEVKTHYEAKSLIDFIESKRDMFESVFMCMYWKDLLEKTEEVKYYESMGYIIVCNGHRHDPRFMSRQKDLLQLADMVVTNEISNCIGYAVSMGTPVFYFDQVVDITLQRIDTIDDSKELARKACKKIFSNFSFEITPEQRSFVEYYWGK